MLFYPHSLGWSGECCRIVGIAVVSLLCLTSVCLSAETEIPVLATDTQLATAGYYQLSWHPGVAGASNKNFQFELQQSTDPEFRSSRNVYHGPDRASVISGQPNGSYYYRVRGLLSGQPVTEWSQSIVVQVQHHSLQKAWLFFVAGAIVFFITLVFIILSARNKHGV